MRIGPIEIFIILLEFLIPIAVLVILVRNYSMLKKQIQINKGLEVEVTRLKQQVAVLQAQNKTK